MFNRSRLSLGWGGLYLLLAFLFVAYVRFNSGYAVDDSYITFRYAQNALDGHGFVFNVGQKYYGSTATGYAIFLYLIVKLAAFVGILVDIHQVATVLSALSITSIAWVCACLVVGSGASRVRWLLAAMVALLVFILPVSSIVAAHETYTYVALLVAASYVAIFNKRTYVAAVLLLLATLTRPDSLLFAMILLGAMFASSWLAKPRSINWQVVRAGGVYVIGLAAWLVSMKMYYGTFFPGTMDAKKAQVLLGDFPLFTFSAVSAALDQQMAGAYWVLLAAVSCAAAFVALKQLLMRKGNVSERALFSIVWFVFAVGLFSAYLTFNVTLWFWYVAPIGLALLLAAVGSLSSLAADSAESPVTRNFWVGCGTALLAMTFVVTQPSGVALTKQFWQGKNVNTHLQSYDPIVAFLRANEPNGTSIAIAEPGTFGFKVGPNYQVYDVLGLASPGVAKALLKGDRNYVVRTWRPKYVVVSWHGEFNPDRQPGFDKMYEKIGEFRHPYWDQTIKTGAMLYRLR